VHESPGRPPGSCPFRSLRATTSSSAAADSTSIRSWRSRSFPEGGPFPWAGGEREILSWTAIRTDLRQRVYGTLALDIWNNPSLNYYADRGFVRVMPAPNWRRYSKTLKYIQSHIVYLPLGP
jgi:hypothetical protein